MINIHKAIYAINQSIVTIKGDIAYDVNGNEVSYHTEQVEAKAIELEAQAKADAQAAVDAKQSALNKLMALGLTEEEALALGVK